MYLPGLITGVISTWHYGLLKTFLTHPSLLLLPTFSYFTFESNTKKCCAKSDPSNDVEIRFSVKWTYLNIFFSQASLLVNIAVSGAAYGLFTFPDALLVFLYVSFGILPAILLTIIFLFISSPPKNCTCCFSPLEINVYKPSSPSKVFVLDNFSKEVKEVEEIDLREEQADSYGACYAILWRGEVTLTKVMSMEGENGGTSAEEN